MREIEIVGGGLSGLSSGYLSAQARRAGQDFRGGRLTRGTKCAGSLCVVLAVMS